MKIKDMFFNEEVAKKFARHEQNEHNYKTAKVFDILSLNFLKNKTSSLHIVDIFAGAHPDRYDNLFNLIINNKGKFDWVDYSPVMLKLAREYLKLTNDKREEVINFIEKDALSYLENLKDGILNLVLIKYSLDYIKNLDYFFNLLYKKMSNDSYLISTLTMPSNILKSHSTNARFSYDGKRIPIGTQIELLDGDQFSIEFFKESGNPNSNLIENAKTTKYYFSVDTIESLAKKNGFKVYVSDWKEHIKKIPNDLLDFDLKVLILEKGDITQ